MKVKIAHNGTIITFVTICEHANVLKIKELLSEMQSVAVDQITLSYHGIKLEDEQSLFKYRIFNGSTVVLELPKDVLPMCHLNLSLPGKEQLVVAVPINATVEQVVQILVETCKHKLFCPGLVFDHWSMQDDHCLCRYGVDATSSIMVTEKMTSVRAHDGDMTDKDQAYKIETPATANIVS